MRHAAVTKELRHRHFPLQDPPSLVLLVERDLACRLRCAHELLDYGYEVVESESPSEARGVLDGRDDFDVMIADIHPDEAPGGLALVRYAASHHPSMKILVDSDWPGARAEANDVGAGVMPKLRHGGVLAQQMRHLFDEPPVVAPWAGNSCRPGE